jgi:hypothetical protein
VDRRGKNAGQDAAWSLVELQDLPDEWIVACFPGRFKIHFGSDLNFYVTHMSAT